VLSLIVRELLLLLVAILWPAGKGLYSQWGISHVLYARENS
jgi:hypothetical protein